MSSIEKYIKNKDVESLVYIFADSLDIDPTFETYREDFERCKTEIPQLFQEHREMTPFSDNKADWDKTYWAKLKLDLRNNFSEKRFEHMKEVAQVIFKERIDAIKKEKQEEKERVIRQEKEKEQPRGAKRVQTERVVEKKEKPQQSVRQEGQEIVSRNTSENARLKQEESERIEKRKRALEEQNKQEAEAEIKKQKGIVLVIIAIVAIVAAILFRK